MPTWNMCVYSQELIYCQGTDGCPHLRGFFSKLFKQRMSWCRILEKRTQMLTHRQSEAGQLIRTGTHSAGGCSPIVTFYTLISECACTQDCPVSIKNILGDLIDASAYKKLPCVKFYLCFFLLFLFLRL